MTQAAKQQSSSQIQGNQANRQFMSEDLKMAGFKQENQIATDAWEIANEYSQDAQTRGQLLSRIGQLINSPNQVSSK